MTTIDPDFDQAGFDAWLATRPPVIQALAQRVQVNRLYRFGNGLHRGYVLSWNENGTVTMAVTGQFNRVLFSRSVFGVPADDCVECDLPGPDEDVGDMSVEAGYSHEDVRDILLPQREQRRAQQAEPNDDGPRLEEV